MKKLINKNQDGFTLIELLLAIAIFAIVVTSSLVLAMDAYRSRANDRVKVAAGLTIKDTINGLYSYKTDYWSEVISNVDGTPKNLQLVESKYQITDGEFTQDGITYNMIFEKALRDVDTDEIIISGAGTEPSTIKITIQASWLDLYGNNQVITEEYFLTDWSSIPWFETSTADFTDGSPVPVLNDTVVDSDSVVLETKSPIANDWCTISFTPGSQNAQGYDLFPAGDENDIGEVYAVSAPSNDGVTEYAIVEPTILVTPTSPPAPANPIVTSSSQTAVCEDLASNMEDEQCEALVKLYNITNGDAWTTNTDWLTGPTPCDWYGVDCTGTNITSLDLSNNNLSGPLVREIGLLTTIVELNLSSNNLSGPLIPEIGLLTSLVDLDLSNNALTGVIPKTIGNLTTLTSLNLSQNQITGKIPEHIGLLSNLDELYLQSNELTCHVPPEIMNVTLTTANLTNNNMVPVAIGDLTSYLASAGTSVIDANQDDVLDHEDCTYAPIYSDSAIVSQFNDSEGIDEPVATEININNSEFELDITDTIYENAPWNEPGGDFISGALDFDGNDVIEIPYSRDWDLIDGDFTVSMWVKRDGVQTGTSKLMDFHGSGEGWYLNMNTDSSYSFFYEADVSGNDLDLTSGVVADDNWHHIAVVLKNGVGTIYIDSVSADTDAYSVLTKVTDTNKSLYIGNDSTTTGGFNGIIDDVRLLERAMSVDEVNQTKYVQIDKKDPGLIGNWRFDEDPFDTEVEDLSYQEQSGFAGYPGGCISWFILNCSDAPYPIDGITRFRINDIKQDGDMVYMTTSYDEMEFIYFNKSMSNVVYRWINLTTNPGDPYSIATSEDSLFISEGADVYQFLKSALFFDVETGGEQNIGSFDYRMKNMKNGCDQLLSPCEVTQGLSNVSEMVFRSDPVYGDVLYVVGIDEDYNFGILDVSYGPGSLSSQPFVYSDLEIRNLYLDILL